MQFPKTLPEPHRQFLERAISVLSADPRISGVAAAGSYADDRMDEFSDIDLVVAVLPDEFSSILEDRHRIAAEIAPLLVSFTGEHVGDPRLLICLFGPPALHVDLKFIKVQDAANRVDEPVVLWVRETALSGVLRNSEARYPTPAPQWIEDRFWVWIHYAAAKVGRGENLEASEFLSFLRTTVLAPLGLSQLGQRPSGVRRVEQIAPQLARELEQTVAALDSQSLIHSLGMAVAIYRRMRDQLEIPISRHNAAELAAIDYLAQVARKLGVSL